MRYRIGEQPADPFTATDPWLTFTVILGLVVGVCLVWLGVKGRQMWLIVWSAGLILASIASLAWFVVAPS